MTKRSEPLYSVAWLGPVFRNDPRAAAHLGLGAAQRSLRRRCDKASARKAFAFALVVAVTPTVNRPAATARSKRGHQFAPLTLCVRARRPRRASSSAHSSPTRMGR